MGCDVPQRLPGDTQDQDLLGRRHPHIVDVEPNVDPELGERGDEIFDTVDPSAGRHLDRVDAAQEAAQRSHRMSGRCGHLGQRYGLFWCRLGERSETERDADQVLDDTVVDLGGHAATLGVGHFEHPFEQVGVPPLRPIQSPPQEQYEEQLRDRERDECRGHRRHELPPQRVGALRDELVRRVDLEQERRTRDGLGPRVHLHQ